MKNSIACLASFCLLASGTCAAEKQAPAPVTLTFYIAGMECSACSDFINSALCQVKSVTGVQVESFGTMNVSFDARTASAHQVAQAVAEALPLHGKPYEATLKIRVPDYTKGGNAAKVDAVFAQQKQWISVETIDKARGEFAIHFLPLKADKNKMEPQGWDPVRIVHALQDPAPSGLGLAFVLVKEGEPEPTPKTAPQEK